MPQDTSIYEFGPFQVNPGERMLSENGTSISLTPKCFETLLVLVENNGHVVTKNDLMRRVWPDSFVEEATLAKNIFSVRKLLRDDQDEPKYIETVPKVGYRFIAPVRNGNQNRAPSTVSADAPRKTTAFVAGAIFVLSVLGILAYRFWPHSDAGARSVTRVGLAVLPFDNLSGDPSQDFLSEGLTEEMITDLGSLDPSRLGVIARTSAMLYKNSPKSAQQIGRELGVDFLLEGSVRREGDRVRVTTQLIRANEQTQVWASSYDRDMGGILALQNEIASKVAGHIAEQLSFDPVRKDIRPSNPAAYELYLEARHFWSRRTAESIAKAMQLLTKAIALDANFAKAHAALADCYVIQNIYSLTQQREALSRAWEEASTALSLDPSLGEAYATRGSVDLYEWAFSEANADFRRSVQLAPQYATGHQWYGEYLRFIGHQQEAMEESKRALELDPLSPIINVEAALPHYYLGDYDSAITQLKRAIDLDPYFALAHGHLANVYLARGMYTEALQEDLVAKQLGDSPWIESRLAVIHAHLGHLEKTRELLPTLKGSIQITYLYMELGERESALAEIERAYAQHNWELAGLKADPGLDPLRGEPRFQAVLRNMDFPQ